MYMHLLAFCYQYQLLLLAHLLLVSPLSMMTLAHIADQYGPVDNELMGISSITTVALVMPPNLFQKPEHQIAFCLCYQGCLQQHLK